VAKAIESERRESSTARVPTVPPGKAIVYTRYGQEKTVVVNPQDFHRLAAIDEALAEFASDRPKLTDLVREAHRLEDEPGEPIEDAGQIRALLDL